MSKYTVKEANGLACNGKSWNEGDDISIRDIPDLKLEHWIKIGAIVDVKEVKPAQNKAITSKKNTKGVK